ncbi:MAG: hypothetical protein EXR99_09140 [Gemmataceae bacterium]|nr:hypothetical protein [Gemmataceae bacterium]
MNPEGKLKNLPIIHLTLVMGLVMFLGLSWILNKDKKLILDWNHPLVLVLLAVSSGGVTAAFLVPMGIVASSLKKLARNKQGNAGTLADLLIGAHIARMAMFEGPALFGLLVFFLHANLAGLYLALILIALMAALFPFPGKSLEKWQSLEERYQLIVQEGQGV